uniref:Secreted protein n=1 Tax=Haptolina brevifila TaxID=156173 RepID=A0A7S2GKI6_9EUKA|eukprot:CAMPEP_0174718710 /NCGR_PEP_ID=MMETSP1094-20130205/29780_1 /TAXON_ID=156173 /ORGANISM="Chrysochromulina brevifilum, Strain UTEX LB 985" /LENGTH=133 /DNA_ID=CAMNT_0015918879 /DNA_START=54 /DNA_END=455 /DNA_ORIENTATION=+
MLRTLIFTALSAVVNAVLLDGAVATMLGAGLTGVAPPMQLNNIAAMPAPMRAHATAMLMSPMPVLTNIVRHQIQQTAMRSAQCASNLLDLSMSDSDVPMEAEPLLEVPEGEGVGSTAMVGAAAAALALMNLRH